MDFVEDDNSTNVTFTNITFTYPPVTVVLSGVSCGLSILGAVLILTSYCLIPEIRNVTRKLVLCLTLADTITAAGYLIAVVRYVIEVDHTPETRTGTTLCLIQSIITTYSSLVSFFLTVFVALHITLIVFLRDTWTGSQRYLVIVNLVSWAVPAAVVVAAVSEGELGEDKGGLAGTGPWCWINTRRTEGLGPIFWMVVTGKCWEIICYVLTTMFYFLLKIRLYLRHRDDIVFYALHANVRREDNNFLYIWFVLYLLRLWGTIRFFIYAFQYRDKEPHASYDTIMQVLMYLQAIGDPLQAFCNAILVCVFDGTVRRIMWQKMTSCATARATPDFEESQDSPGFQNSDVSDYGSFNTRQLARRYFIR